MLSLTAAARCPGIASKGSRKSISVFSSAREVSAQFLEDPDQRQLLACSLRRITRQQLVDLCCPSSELRSRLDLTLVFEGSLARPQHLAHRIPGHPQVPGDLLDRLALEKMLTPNPTDRLHRQHSPTTCFD